MADEGLIQRLLLRYNVLSKGNLTYSVRLIELLVAVPTTLVIWRTYGLRSTIRYFSGLTLALATQRAFISAMIRKIGPEELYFFPSVLTCKCSSRNCFSST